MAADWADTIAQQLLDSVSVGSGLCLILGASDTGKTTLAESLAKQAASSRPVAIVDADIGQSHIGPPATVGWAIADGRKDFPQLPVKGISFVGDVTPTGHLLQLTAAIAQCVQRASEAVGLIIMDTPGLIHGPAAAALWWTIQHISKPASILAVQRSNELKDILVGFEFLYTKLVFINCPEEILTKSPLARQRYRQKQFAEYFRDTCFYNISLKKVTVQRSRVSIYNNLINRLLALRDGNGTDLAIGVITDWRQSDNIVVVRAPKLDIALVRCIVIGDISVDISVLTQAEKRN
jgi:polynucleotide 5'-hydroxyl-kinase GRC3/NOL9